MKLLAPFVLPILLSVAGCATSGPAGPNPGCEWAGPIFLSDDDKITTETETAILEHNETWERVCRK